MTVRAFLCEHPARGSAQDHLPTPSASPVPRNHPAGRPAGSARTRSRDQSLENPFLGTASVFPRPPSPKTPQAAGPCSWACRRLLPPPPQPERNKAPKPPARGAWARRIRANGTGRRHCRPAGGKSLLVDLPPSARTVAPFGTKRSAQAPCSWGLGASPRRQRLWLPAPPARPYAKFMYIFSLGVDFWRRFAYNYTL